MTATQIKEARIQHAVAGLLIPLTSLVAVYDHASTLIDAGATDTALVLSVSELVGKAA